jgi:hypothetical protein
MFINKGSNTRMVNITLQGASCIIKKTMIKWAEHVEYTGKLISSCNIVNYTLEGRDNCQT